MNFDDAVTELERISGIPGGPGAGYIVPLLPETTGPALASVLDLPRSLLRTVGEQLADVGNGVAWTESERISGLHALTTFMLSWRARPEGLMYFQNDLHTLCGVLIPLKGRGRARP
ncbi:hypothetical protein [Deinococcus aestuarii]|uniref:hypothetical protein n=1 Tax=Deinococcus aestuarii TaxID=2774531 RepID=UPI001C0D61D3|nr:hypothetical protein [Deinococcus aestuarii]